MNKFKSLAKTQLVSSTMSMLLTTVLTSGVGFFFWKIFADYFTQSQVGEATTISAIILTASLLSVSGMSPAIMLALSHRGHELDYKSLMHGYALIAAIASGTITVLVEAVLLLSFKQYAFLGDPVVFISAAIFASAYAAGITVDSSHISLHKSQMMPLRQTMMSLIKILILFPVVLLGISSPVAAMSTSAVGAIIATCYVLVRTSGKFYMLRGVIKPAWNTIKHDIWHHQASQLGFTLPPALVPLIITAMLGTAESALFTMAWMIGSIFFTISPSVASAIIASTANNGEVNIRKRIKQAVILISILMAPTMAIVICFPKQILSLFQPEYAAGSWLLILLAVSAIPDAITNIATAYLRLKNDLKPATVLNVSMGITTVVLVLALTGVFAGDSAGYAWLAAQTLGAVGIGIYIIAKRRVLSNKVVKPSTL